MVSKGCIHHDWEGVVVRMALSAEGGHDTVGLHMARDPKAGLRQNQGQI